MKIKLNLKISRELDIDCEDCPHLVKHPFDDDAYGATKTFYEYSCQCPDLATECHHVIEELEILEASYDIDEDSIRVHE